MTYSTIPRRSRRAKLAIWTLITVLLVILAWVVVLMAWSNWTSPAVGYAPAAVGSSIAAPATKGLPAASTDRTPWTATACTDGSTSSDLFWQKGGPHSRFVGGSDNFPRVAPRIDTSGLTATWRVYPQGQAVTGFYQARKGRSCVTGELRMVDQGDGSVVAVAVYPKGYSIRWGFITLKDPAQTGD